MVEKFVSRQEAECPLCSSPSALHIQLPHTEVRRCLSRKCHLEFAFPQLDSRQLGTAYSQLYYPGSDGSEAHYENTPEEVLLQVFDKLSSQFGSLKGKRLLDFGCGVGRLCMVARQFGIETTGIEANANAREIARQTGTLNVYAELGELRAGSEIKQFDMIVMWEVIEHLREPWKDLHDMREFLKPNGRIVISTPNANSLKARLFRNRWDNYVNPTHFYYFFPTSLSLALRKASYHEISQLYFAIEYPHHSLFRSIVHRALLRSSLDGELLFTAEPALCEDALENRSK